MLEPHNADRPRENPPGELPPPASLSPAQDRAAEQASDPLVPSPSDLDREVSEAMAALSAGGLSDKADNITPAESIELGAELTGTIVGLSGDEVYLEFNAKAQGVMLRSQFGKKEAIEIGRLVDVVVDRHDPDSDMLTVVRKGAIQRANWMNLSVGMLVEGRVTGLIRGGLEINLQGIRAFMPNSQVSLSPLKDTSVLLNEKVRCLVIEVNRRGKSVLVSRRKAMELELADVREALKKELEVGQTRRGIVKNTTTFGAFVDLGGLEGLIHISDLSWSTVAKVTDVLSPGQEVEVRVLKVDADCKRISLGLKQAQPDPWSIVPDRYPVGTSLKVKIVRVADFGAFAELEAGIEGLIPFSELGWKRVNRVADVVSPGDMVDAVVIRVEPQKRRLALSMKQAQPDPWDGVLDGFTENSIAKGSITRLADFGAFVEIAPGVEGLIHISELADERVKSCSSVVQVGQEVEARVLGVDKENRRISLSLRKAKDPTPAPSDNADSSPAPPPKQRKKPLRGGLSSHYDW